VWGQVIGLEGLFWVLSGLVVYVYAGYPLIVFVLARARRFAPPAEPSPLPTVTLIFCVHNEEAILDAKIANCRAIDYPPDRLTILAASDGSTDGSAERLQLLERQGVLRALVQPERSGKTSLLNRAVAMVTTELVLFTDASTLLRTASLRRHVRHFSDARVGCVGGDLDFINIGRGGVSAGHGLYWRYEAAIRRAESDLGMLAYVSGANYSLRRALWKPVPGEFADDCISPLNVVAAGHRVVYDPDAVAEEVASETQRGLFARRVRMVTRDLDATLRHGHLLNPFRYGAVAVSLLSHKLLRWLIAPSLVIILALSVALASRPLYLSLLVVQLMFYGLGFVASLGSGRPKSPLLSVPLYFCVSNLGALRGLVNVVLRRRIGVWQPVGTR
jgi:cellulose synthase/poly-beta-1,6-N-acetylglucosamine synthase-like glycosyltransferase